MKHVYNKMRLVLVVSTLIVACGSSDKSEPASVIHDGGLDFDAGDSGLIDGLDMRPDAQPMDVVCGSSGTFYRQNDLAVLVECDRLKGALQLVNYFESGVPEAKTLSHIDEDLIILRAPFLKDLSDFHRIETVGRHLSLADIKEIPEKEGLPSLRFVEGRMTLFLLPIDSLRFPKLERVGGLRIVNMPNVTSLDGLANLQKIDGDLTVAVPGIDETELENFLQRVEVSGTVTFNGQPFGN